MEKYLQNTFRVFEICVLFFSWKKVNMKKIIQETRKLLNTINYFLKSVNQIIKIDFFKFRKKFF